MKKHTSTYKKHIIRAVFLISIVICSCRSSLETISYTKGTDKDIIILYENDVHCAIDGYIQMAGMRDKLRQSNPYVSIVSSGDFTSGDIAGAISKGSYIIDIMNAVGYDVTTLGNHEFDYSIPTMLDMTQRLNAQTVCCNCVEKESHKGLFRPYCIIHYDTLDIAFVGVATPTTITSSTPTFFQDGEGNYIYDFGTAEEICFEVQKSIDQARADGADHVVVLSHLGDESNTILTSRQLIARTQGIDVVLDGHDHKVIHGEKIANAAGDSIILTSTGTKFTYIGKLTIGRDGRISTELYPVKDMAYHSDAVESVVKHIKEDIKATCGQPFAHNTVKLICYDENRMAIARREECNIGDLCTDAFRIMLGADIAFVNSGNLRNNIDTGFINYNHLLSLLPYGNKISLVSMRGQDILDALELSVIEAPLLNGGFLQVSGLLFDVDTSIKSGVELDSKGMFVTVHGERRISNVKILNSTLGTYEPLQPKKIYKVASTSYLLLSNGDGYYFPSMQKIEEDAYLDTDILKRYIIEHLKGIITAPYNTPQHRINYNPTKCSE